MSIEIVDTAEATVDEWSHTFAACRQATFFHGPEWARLWEEYTQGRYRLSPRRVTFSDGCAAVLGLTTERIGFVERRHFSPAGTYGGWVSRDPLDIEHGQALAGEILRTGSLVWRCSPFDESSRALVLPNARVEATHVIDLRQGADVARRRWKPAAHRQVRKAERRGTQFRTGSGVEDWLRYDVLYRRAIQRWGKASQIYDSSFFGLLFRSDSPSIRLFLAETDGETAAGAIVFSAHAHAVYWHGASLGNESPGASNLLQWHIMGVLEAAGIETYDLNPSGGYGGVVRFKESLGAQPLPAPIVIARHPLENVARRATRWERRLVGQPFR